MKTFSVAVAVAVVLTFICVQQSSALPLTDLQLGEPLRFDSTAAEHEEKLVDSGKMLIYSGKMPKPGSCRFCCGCCPNMKGCGHCCTH
uniref:Hepcidin 2 n=1 Tax=Mola mola TaxID=94237 RepID=A0A3Q3WXJ3_MOLML